MCLINNKNHLVCDIETDGLENATRIHVIVVKDTSTGKTRVFDKNLNTFKSFVEDNKDAVWVGHNFIKFDLRVLKKFLGVEIDKRKVIDTLVLSKLLDAGREGGHSLEAWGETLGFPKVAHEDWTIYTPEMLHRCTQDVHLNHKVLDYLLKIVRRNEKAFSKALPMEMLYQFVARDMEDNGFAFDYNKARDLEARLLIRVEELQTLIKNSFPDKVEEVQLKTKTKIVVTPFNPSSVKQVVDRLWEAGWKPVEKTKTHETKIKNHEKIDDRTKRYGWKVNEVNLSTLPAEHPVGFDYLLEHTIISSRLRTLTEWFNAYDPVDGRIHGLFDPLGARTHRCIHSKPNMGNIATKKTIKYNTQALRELATKLGGEMRSLWISSPSCYLVGTDMEGAHLRIFAHLIDDKQFTNALINGCKEDGTDPHSLNKQHLGSVCVDRDRAKTFIFSYLNGAGASKVRDIFSCTLPQASASLLSFNEAYSGLKKIREQRIPTDSQRSYFEGTDGRLVKNSSAHLMMGMYLQNMESVLMKYANLMWIGILDRYKIKYKQVNWVHDEWVTEVYGTRADAEFVAKVQSWTISKVGKMFKLKCPMGGESKIGHNWLEVH